MLTNILLVLNGSSAAESAHHYARELAERLGSRVTAAAFLDTVSGLHQAVPIGGMSFAKQALEENVQAVRSRIQAISRRVVDGLRLRGIEPKIIHAEGDPIALLLDEWRYHDLTVASLRSLFDHELVPDPVAAIRRLLIAGVRPILAVPETPRPVRTVVAHSDGSLVAAKALKRFVQMGLYPEVQIHLVACAASSDELRQHHHRSVHYCADHGFPDVHSHILDGSAQQRLIPFCKELNADLLIMGDGAPSVWQRFRGGDLVVHCIRQAECALFLAH